MHCFKALCRTNSVLFDHVVLKINWFLYLFILGFFRVILSPLTLGSYFNIPFSQIYNILQLSVCDSSILIVYLMSQFSWKGGSSKVFLAISLLFYDSPQLWRNSWNNKIKWRKIPFVMFILNTRIISRLIFVLGFN